MAKVKTALLAIGMIVIAVVSVMVGLRAAGVPIPYVWSDTQPAPEGSAVTITLLAFCKDNTTEVLSVKEFKYSLISLVSRTGKEIKYFAVVAMFLVGPPSGQSLQQVDLGYTITLIAQPGSGPAVPVGSPIAKTVRLTIVHGLGMYEGDAIPVTPEQLGLKNVGDQSTLSISVSVSADMTTTTARMVMTSKGQAEAHMTLQEGGYMTGQASGTITQASQGRIVAYLGGSWEKPVWRTLAVVHVVDNQGNVHSLEADPGDTTPDVHPLPPEPKPPSGPIQGPPSEPLDRDTAPTREPEPPSDGGGHPEDSGAGGKPEAWLTFAWVTLVVKPLTFLDDVFTGRIWNSYRLLWPFRIPGTTLEIDLVWPVAFIVALCLITLGLAIKEKKTETNANTKSK